MASTGSKVPPQTPSSGEKQQAALAARREFLRAERDKEAAREAWNDWREPTEAEF